MKRMTFLLLLLVSLMTGSTLAQQFTTLRGTKFKVQAAYDASIAHDYTPMRDADHVQRFVKLKLLVRLPGNTNYSLHQVGHPYLRPAAKLLVDRLSQQYKKATGEKLVVTSATRTLDNAPWNASSKSVHPMGMAVDFRIPQKASSRQWLESALLVMQSRGVVISTRERNPPHYHIVVLPKKYEAYVRLQQRRR